MLDIAGASTAHEAVSHDVAPPLGAGSALDAFRRLHRLSFEMLYERGIPRSADGETSTHSGQEWPVLAFGTADVGASVADLWFINSYCLRLRLAPPAAPAGRSVRWRAFQIIPGASRAVEVGSHLVERGPIAYFDLDLVNPLFPVLFLAATGVDEVFASAILPFPSLCRGGLHYAELCATAQADDLVSGLCRVSSRLLAAALAGRDGGVAPLVTVLEIDLRGAIGAEPIFDRAVGDWLDWFAGLSRRPISADSIGNTPVRDFLQRRLAGSAIAADPGGDPVALVLTADALPSLHALVATAADAPDGPPLVAVDFVIAAKGVADPLWSVAMPPLGSDFLALQPFGAAPVYPLLRRGRSDQTARTAPPPATPYAIRYVDIAPPGAKVSRLAPVAPDIPAAEIDVSAPGAPRISVLVPAFTALAEGLGPLLESIAAQSGADSVDVTLVSSAAADADWARAGAMLARLFPGRHTLHRVASDLSWSDRVALAARDAMGEFLLVAAETVLLHDQRTLAVLAGLAAQPGIGSAGCLLVRSGLSQREDEVTPYSCGYFPILGREPEIVDTLSVSEFDCHTAFPTAILPVAANAPPLLMTRAAVLAESWPTSTPSDGVDPALDFAQRTAQRGLMHLCTTAVSASVKVAVAPPADRSLTLTVGIGGLAPVFPLAAGVRRLWG